MFGWAGGIGLSLIYRSWHCRRLHGRRPAVGGYFLCLALLGAVGPWADESAGQSLPTATGARDRIELIERRTGGGAQIEAYCRRLSWATVAGGACERVALISFTAKGSQSASWEHEDSVLATMSGVASAVTGENSYSCIRIAFSSPWPEGTDVLFTWAVGSLQRGYKPGQRDAGTGKRRGCYAEVHRRR